MSLHRHRVQERWCGKPYRESRHALLPAILRLPAQSRYHTQHSPLAAKSTPPSLLPLSLTNIPKISIFHFAFEGLIVNEVRPLRLIDHKYGLDIEVPGAAILSSFGFNNNNLQTDVISLGVFCAVFLVLAYGAMHFLLVERR
jgi:hypothetical protein